MITFSLSLWFKTINAVIFFLCSIFLFHIIILTLVCFFANSSHLNCHKYFHNCFTFQILHTVPTFQPLSCSQSSFQSHFNINFSCQVSFSHVLCFSPLSSLFFSSSNILHIFCFPTLLTCCFCISAFLLFSSFHLTVVLPV